MEAYLLYYDNDRSVARLPLPKTPVTLGSSRNDLMAVHDPTVEPQHVRMEFSAQRATWDLTRLAGEGIVQINGVDVALDEAVPLSQHAAIRLGGTSMRFCRKPAAPHWGDAEADSIPLGNQTVIMGREHLTAPAEPGTVRIDLDSDDSGISRIHVIIAFEDGKWHIEDRSRRGSDLNGQAFTKERLTLGDRFRIRDYSFEFAGTKIVRVDSSSGGRLEVDGASVVVETPERSRKILHEVSISIRSGEFLGILGGSGHGKSTLLRALCGLSVLSGGEISIDGESVDMAAARGLIGFVPQDDIVHAELTVQAALLFSARLRIAARGEEISCLVETIIRRMGLAEQSLQPVHTLSGGQRKRVNIATELLTRPPVLLLDEPSSGLDPVHEEELMTLLKSLTTTGQTVIASTHVLHKAYLFDRICFIHRGQLMFTGTTAEARRFFFDDDDTGTQLRHQAALERIYFLFSQNSGQTAVWHQKYADSAYARNGMRDGAPPPPALTHVAEPGAVRPGSLTRLRVLIARQWAILTADPLDLRFLGAQAVVIGFLAGWAGRAQPEFRMFLTMIATLWFGCSNAAQQFTREIPIFRRERVSGLGIHAYVQSKWIFLTAITIAQCLVMLACMAGVLGLCSLLGGEALGFPDTQTAWPNGTGWLLHAASFLLACVVGTGMGLAVSARARSSTQAAIWVPLLLIPQILFAGFVIPLPDMPVTVRYVSRLVPSASAQRLLDLGHVFGKAVPPMIHSTITPLFWKPRKEVPDKDEPKPFPTTKSLAKPLAMTNQENPSPMTPGSRELYEISPLNRAWQNTVVKFEELGERAPEEPPNHMIYQTSRPDVEFEAGKPFQDFSGALWSVFLLVLWTGACYLIAIGGLVRRDPLRGHTPPPSPLS